METGMTSTSLDRRRTCRHIRVEEHGIVRARVRPGHDVSVIDISACGALIESIHRLMPGACVELHLRRNTADAEVVRGRVLRCSVSTLSANLVCYRGAIVFERPLPWWDDNDAGGYVLHTAESRVIPSRREDATRGLL
jgi:hypothetical protein